MPAPHLPRDGQGDHRAGPCRCPHLVEASSHTGECIDLTDNTAYPIDGSYYPYDAAVDHGVSSWDTTAVDEVYGPEADGLRTLELRPDHEDSPWGEDWYDPDTDQTGDAYDRFAAPELAGTHRGVKQERERLVAARESFKELVRTYHPDVAQVAIAVESDGVYIDHATDREGNTVYLDSRWPDDVGADDVNEGLRSMMSSPNDGDLAEVWGWSNDAYRIDL